jgi:hypothetical protein
MASIWTLAKIGELEFAAISRLLALKAKGMSLSPTEQADDESSDEDELEENEGGGMTSRLSDLATCDHDALLNKFLDRLGEVFSREKSASHVAAIALIRADVRNPMTVLVAKNEGLDDRDLRMLFRLQQWLRAVAITGRDRSILTDSLWVGEAGLIEYSRQRLWYHISRVQKDRKVASLAALPSDVSMHITRLQCLCRNAKVDSPVREFSDIVETAYNIRYMWESCRVDGEVMKAVRDINMLGRLRAAYECFKSIALTFDDVQDMKLEPVAKIQDLQLNASVFQRLLKKHCRDLQLPKEILKSNAAYKYNNACSLHVHAEMQILVILGQNPGWHKRAHPYIGVSKKLCFLCDQILQNYRPLAQQGARRPTFKTRPCHGKVYPLWTLPLGLDLLLTSKLSLAMAVTYAHRLIRHKLQQKKKLELHPAMAESTAGVTTAESLSIDLAQLRDQHLADGRPQDTPDVGNGSERSSVLGPTVATAKVGMMPADGTNPRLVSITFHALSETGGHKTIEVGGQHVLTFHRYWGSHQFDRRLWNITFEDQADESWNGKYRLYWNENHALPENKTVKRLLGEKEINLMRRFWYGDVFFMKYSEHPKTLKFDVHDLPFTMPECRTVLQHVFRGMWEKKILEDELEQDRFVAERQEKFEADKAILLQRMSVAPVPLCHDIVRLTFSFTGRR